MMATSLTAAILLTYYKKWGVKYKPYVPLNGTTSSWLTHNRNAQQGWGPIYGAILHCFASDISDSSSNAYIWNGDAGRALPGPLSQDTVDDTGIVWLTGWGTANHAKTIDTDTHKLVIADKMPLDRDIVPNTNGNSTSGVFSANPHYIGTEMLYGTRPTAAQYDGAVRQHAALMDMLGCTAGSIVGHREATTSRSDPTAVPMYKFRRDVNALLKAGPAITVIPSVPVRPPTTTTGGTVATTSDSQLLKETHDRLFGIYPQRYFTMDATGKAVVSPEDVNGKPTAVGAVPARGLDQLDGNSIQRNISEGRTANEEAFKALEAKVDALTEALKALLPKDPA